MKKRFILTLLLVLSATCFLTACSTDYKIKSAFAKATNVNVNTVFYTSYGEYNGAHAIMISADGLAYGCAITYDVVGGVTITYPDTHTMDVYYEGKFYSLSQAYENGLLTDSDLIEIAKK